MQTSEFHKITSVFTLKNITKMLLHAQMFTAFIDNKYRCHPLFQPIVFQDIIMDLNRHIINTTHLRKVSEE